MLTALLAFASITSFAATSGDFEYTVLSDGTAEIRGYSGNATNLTIPSKIGGYTVTKLSGYKAFENCTNLKSVTIPNGVTSIGYGVFMNCTSLTSVTIPNSVTSISTNAFQYCSSLTNIKIPDGVKSIGEFAFYGCSNLTSITIPNGVKSIGRSTFYACIRLTNITIGSSVTSIGDYAFSGCESLKNITIGNSVTSIGESAFSLCKSLTSVTLGNGVTSIGFRAFDGCPIEDVYYKGTREQWNKISIDSYNHALSNIHFEGEAEHRHSYKSVVAAPTCTKQGYTTHTCSGCGDSYVDNYVAAKGHTPDNGTVTKAATYTATGTKTYKCTVCGTTIKTETIAKKTLSTPKLSAVKNTATGVNITWGKVTGATKYRVFYKTGNGSWTGIANTTATSYTWTGAKSGTKYTFTVRCLDKDGNYISSFDSTGKSITYVAAPKLSAVKNTATGVNITWGKVIGAAKYRVFYKTAGGSWTGIANTTATSYTWTGVKSGTKYTFTVRCLDKSGNYISSFDSTGKSITYVAAPKLSAVKNTATGVNITWGKVTGAAKYRVFYKTAGGSWTGIANTTATSYTWTGAKSGTKYTFTVRCLDKNGNYISSFDSTGKSITYVAAPKLSAVKNTATGVNITWAKSAGAVKYRVFYKTGHGTWTKIADTTSTSYTWKGAKSGIKYTFTVRCVDKDGKSYTSSFDGTGKTITR